MERPASDSRSQVQLAPRVSSHVFALNNSKYAFMSSLGNACWNESHSRPRGQLASRVSSSSHVFALNNSKYAFISSLGNACWNESHSRPRRQLASRQRAYSSTQNDKQRPHLAKQRNVLAMSSRWIRVKGSENSVVLLALDGRKGLQRSSLQELFPGVVTLGIRMKRTNDLKWYVFARTPKSSKLLIRMGLCNDMARVWNVREYCGHMGDMLECLSECSARAKFRAIVTDEVGLTDRWFFARNILS